MQYCVAVGNPFDGVTLYGPYETSEEAEESEEFNNGSDAWIVTLYQPGED